MNWFTQSPEWEELQRREGRKTYRIEGALVVEYSLPFGKTYWEVARGPDKPGSLQGLKKYALSMSKGFVFLRIDPPVEEGNETWRESFRHLQFRPAPNNYYFSAVSPPLEIAVVDLTQSEEERLANIHEKTRYNIRLAERKGVRVEFARSERLFGEFWQLLSKTAQREGFRIHERRHYETVLAAFPSAEIGVASLNGESLAAGLFLTFDGWIHYLHGGSTREHREVMAPYLLHWRAMERVRERALQYYDFGGIAPADALRRAQGKHPWAGETRFKLNFGASRLRFLPAYDLAISPMWYRLYVLARKVRRNL